MLESCSDLKSRLLQAEVTVHNAQELLCFIRLACALRATEATGVHDQSSRSHAVCRIFINREGSQEGILQLIDLAGSEHRIDSAEHDAARRKEGAQINSSLAALKECVRCKATPKVGGNAPFLPYRKSKLTHLLRACFEEGNPTVVIATVSPSSKDTEHSLNTIRHACIMDGQGSGSLEPKPSVAGRNGMPETIKMASHIKCVTTASHVIGGEVTKQNIGEIDITKLARERRAQRIAEKADGSGGDGQGKWNDAPPKKPEDATTPAESDRRRTQSMAAAERKALRALEPERIKQLEQARAKVCPFFCLSCFAPSAPASSSTSVCVFASSPPLPPPVYACYDCSTNAVY